MLISTSIPHPRTFAAYLLSISHDFPIEYSLPDKEQGQPLGLNGRPSHPSSPCLFKKGFDATRRIFRLMQKFHKTPMRDRSGRIRRSHTKLLLILGFWGVIGLAMLVKGQNLPVRFIDVFAETGIHFKHDNAASAEKYFPETMSAGCGWIDYNNNGFLDAYFVQSTETHLYKPNEPLRSSLYRSNGDGTFTDVTQQASVGAEGLFGSGVAAADYDNDGHQDLYVMGWGRSILYRNNGNGTFADVTSKAGVANEGLWGSSAAFFDYDKDGHLDLMVANYIQWSPEKNIYCGEHRPGYRAYCHPDNHEGQLPTLYHNDGDGTFSNVTEQAGLGGEPGKGLGLVAADFNNDGWIDVFQANDSIRNFLFLNKRNGTFEDVTFTAGVGYSGDGIPEAGMGTDAADIDGDGWMDLYVTHLDFQLDRLYRNNGNGTFNDVTYQSQIGNQVTLYSGFGTRFFDYDHDGWVDLFVANGHILDNIHLFHQDVSYAEPNLMFRNVGGGKFENVSSQLGPDFSVPRVSRAAALGDYDNDGDLDILISNNGQAPQLLRNDAAHGNHWLSVSLRGTRSNRDGIGARLTLIAGERKQFKEAKGGMSFQAAQDPRIHFGLGSRTTADSLEIAWPSGLVDRLENLPGDQILTVEEGVGIVPRSFPKFRSAGGSASRLP